MAKVNLNTIKNWFKTGQKPTQIQFWSAWDSFWHKDEQIPASKIENLDSLLNEKADQEALGNHINSTSDDLDGKVDKEDGKELSETNFSKSEKTKLADLSEISVTDHLGTPKFTIKDALSFGSGFLIDPVNKRIEATATQTIYTNIPYNLNRSGGLRITKTGKLVSINFNSYITIDELDDALPTTFLNLFTLPLELRPHLNGHNNIKTIVHGNNGGYFARIFNLTGAVFVYLNEPIYGSVVEAPGSELHLNITYETF